MRNIGRRYIHQVEVSRPNRVPRSGGVLSNTTPLGAMPCLVLGVNANGQNSPLGRVEGARWTISWSALELIDGDLIEYQGKRYTLREVLRDNVGGYNTGILSESSGG